MAGTKTKTNPVNDEQAARVEAILAKVDSIPPLPAVASRLLSLRGGSDNETSELVKIIESDPALAARMLGLCRRADKGLGERITSVKHAVLLLGPPAIKSSVLSLCVHNVMSNDLDKKRKRAETEAAAAAGDAVSEASGPLSFDRRGFWKHCVAVACCAQILAEANPRRGVIGSEAFMAGLLHGVGKIVLEYALPRAYGSVVRLAREKSCRSFDVEMQLLGVDYQTAGARIAEHWELPDLARKAALHHNSTLDCIPAGPQREVLVMVRCAKVICEWLQLGWSGDFAPPEDPSGLWQQTGLEGIGKSGDGLLPIYQKVMEAVADRYEVLGLTPRTPDCVAIESIERGNQNIMRVHESLEQRRIVMQNANQYHELLQRFVAGSVMVGVDLRAQCIRVLRSVWEANGGGRHAIVFQDIHTQQWRAATWFMDHNRKESSTLGAFPEPVAGSKAASWLDQASMDVNQVPLSALGISDWVGGVMGPNINVGGLKAMWITPTGMGELSRVVVGTAGLRVLLISDRELRDDKGLGPVNCAALLAMWYDAIRIALLGERAEAA